VKHPGALARVLLACGDGRRAPWHDHTRQSMALAVPNHLKKRSNRILIGPADLADM